MASSSEVAAKRRALRILRAANVSVLLLLVMAVFVVAATVVATSVFGSVVGVALPAVVGGVVVVAAGLAATVSVGAVGVRLAAAPGGTGVVAAELGVGVLEGVAAVATAAASFSSLDGVEARESTSLPLELVLSDFFGFAAAEAVISALDKATNNESESDVTIASCCNSALLVLDRVVGGMQFRQFPLTLQVRLVVLEHTRLGHPFVPAADKYACCTMCIDPQHIHHLLFAPASIVNEILHRLVFVQLAFQCLCLVDERTVEAQHLLTFDSAKHKRNNAWINLVGRQIRFAITFGELELWWHFRLLVGQLQQQSTNAVMVSR